MSGRLESSDSGVPAMTQRQEDLLLELFTQLSIDDRKVVIKLCRDLLKASQDLA